MLGVDRCHQAIWHWKETLSKTQSESPTASPSRIAVDEKQIEIDIEKKWLYAAIDTESKLLLKVDMFSRRGTDPAAAFLHQLTEKHDIADTEFLIDASGYLTVLARHEQSGHLNYEDRNHIKKIVLDCLDAYRPLPLVLAGQSIKRETLAAAVQIPLYK